MYKLKKKGHRYLRFQAHLPNGQGSWQLNNSSKSFTFKMKLQSKCKTFLVKMSFICMRKKVHFHPYHWLFIQPCFETRTWGNLKMADLKRHVNCKQIQVSNPDGAYKMSILIRILPTKLCIYLKYSIVCIPLPQ